jgi:hypothetical protein
MLKEVSMRLLGFLFHSSQDSLYSRTALLFVLFTSLVAGLANTALIALTNRFVINPGLAQGWGGAFLVLCLILPNFRLISRVLLLHDHFYGLADRIVKLTDGAVEYDSPAPALLELSSRLTLERPGQSFSHA